MSRKVLVHCTGCWETWEAPEKLVGALCGKGQVRLATVEEAEGYAEAVAEGLVK